MELVVDSPVQNHVTIILTLLSGVYPRVYMYKDKLTIGSCEFIYPLVDE